MTTPTSEVTDLMESLADSHGSTNLTRHPRPMIGCPWCIDDDRSDVGLAVLSGHPRREMVRAVLAADDLRRHLAAGLPVGTP